MARYAANLHLEQLVAIDVHTHANISGRAPRDPCAHAFDEAMAKYFRSGTPPAIAEVGQYYRERRWPQMPPGLQFHIPVCETHYAIHKTQNITAIARVLRRKPADSGSRL